MKYPNNFVSEYHHVSIDYNQQIIYLIHGNEGFIGGGIWKIDIKTKEFKHFELGGNYQCAGALGYVTNNKLNIFWGNKHNKHIIWNEENNT